MSENRQADVKKWLREDAQAGKKEKRKNFTQKEEDFIDSGAAL